MIHGKIKNHHKFLVVTIAVLAIVAVSYYFFTIIKQATVVEVLPME